MNKPFWRKLRFIFRRAPFERVLDAEMRHHLELKVEENLRSGMSPEAAGSAARRRFGNWTLTAEDAPQDPNYNPNQLSTYPWTFTVTFAGDGTCSGYHLENTTRYEDGNCTYEATDDRLDVYWPGDHQAFNYTADADGTLHMTAIPPIDPGAKYVTTTKPWIPD